MRNYFSVVIFLSTTVLCFGQNSKKTISGFVYDSTTKEVVIGANIFDLKSKTGTTSNEYGFYSLTVPSADTILFNVAFIGYKIKKLTLTSASENKINILLSFIPFLNEVIITDTLRQNNIRSNETGVINLQIKDIKQLPNLFGEVDVIQALRLTPGVQSGGEGKSNLYVRGGSPDQNLILLDDVPLYYVAHFGGFFSIFNADAINDVKLVKGGFPAHYGSRLSSVLDIRMKEGNMQNTDVQGSIGLLTSKISVSTPIVKEKSSLILSLRGSVLPIFRIIGADINYNFYDVNAKINHVLSDKDRIFLSFYKGDDIVRSRVKSDAGGYESKNTSSTVWGNTLSAFRWNHVYNSKLFSNLTLANTYYKYKTKFEYDFKNDTLYKKINNRLNTAINDIYLKFDYSYFLNPKINFKYGLNSIYHIFTPNDEHYIQEGTSILPIDTFYNSRNEAIENAVYLEGHFNHRLFTSNLGVRFSSFHTGSTNYYFIEPRIVLNYILRDDLSIKYSFSQMNQYVHLLSYSGVGLPYDYWMPTTENVKPESSAQHSVGLYKTFSNKLYELSIEGYYKSMNNLIAFKPGKSLSGNLNSWENLVEMNGQGKNYGLEVFLQKTKGKTTGWISGTIAKAERQFENLNNGEPYPFKYDRPFDCSIVIIQQIKAGIDVSATWTYGSGYPITLATERYQLNGENVLVYEKINSFKMRDYHRLDIAANFRKKKKWGERTWTISVFNLYNRKNPYYYYYERAYIIKNDGSGFQTEPAGLKLYQRSLFSLFPSFAYSFKF